MQQKQEHAAAIHRVETLLEKSLLTTAEHFRASVMVNDNASSSGHNGRSRSSASVINALNEPRSTHTHLLSQLITQQHPLNNNY